MADRLDKDDIIEKIAKRLRCSSCGRRYRPLDFHVIEERGTVAVMKIVCPECRKQSIVFAVVQRKRVQPVFTELEPDEWSRFRQLPPLNPDDVVDIHREMQCYGGDFGDVLEDPLPPEE